MKRKYQLEEGDSEAGGMGCRMSSCWDTGRGLQVWPVEHRGSICNSQANLNYIWRSVMKMTILKDFGFIGLGLNPQWMIKQIYRLRLICRHVWVPLSRSSFPGCYSTRNSHAPANTPKGSGMLGMNAGGSPGFRWQDTWSHLLTCGGPRLTA